MPNSIKKLHINRGMLAGAFSESQSRPGDAIRFKSGFDLSAGNSIAGIGGPHDFTPLSIPIKIKSHQKK